MLLFLKPTVFVPRRINQCPLQRSSPPLPLPWLRGTHKSNQFRCRYVSCWLQAVAKGKHWMKDLLLFGGLLLSSLLIVIAHGSTLLPASAPSWAGTRVRQPGIGEARGQFRTPRIMSHQRHRGSFTSREEIALDVTGVGRAIAFVIGNESVVRQPHIRPRMACSRFAAA